MINMSWALEGGAVNSLFHMLNIAVSYSRYCVDGTINFTQSTLSWSLDNPRRVGDVNHKMNMNMELWNEHGHVNIMM